MMLKIAEVLPKEAQGIIACCYPIPQIVKNELTELHKCSLFNLTFEIKVFRVIKFARDIPLERVSCNSKPTELAKNADEIIISNPTLSANKITKLKAKLEYRIDCSNSKTEDSFPYIENGTLLKKNNCSLETKSLPLQSRELYSNSKCRIYLEDMPKVLNLNIISIIPASHFKTFL